MSAQPPGPPPSGRPTRGRPAPVAGRRLPYDFRLATQLQRPSRTGNTILALMVGVGALGLSSFAAYQIGAQLCGAPDRDWFEERTVAVEVRPGRTYELPFDLPRPGLMAFPVIGGPLAAVGLALRPRRTLLSRVAVAGLVSNAAILAMLWIYYVVLAFKT